MQYTKSMDNQFFYVRLKAHAPKKGFGLLRYHFAGNLFQGGDRPVWYKVNEELATLCKANCQESGMASFDVVTPEDKLEIDKVEENRRLVALGLMSATIATPRGPQMIDLSHREEPKSSTAKGSGRSDALPDAPAVKTPGTVTTADLPTFGIGAK